MDTLRGDKRMAPRRLLILSSACHERLRREVAIDCLVSIDCLVWKAQKRSSAPDESWHIGVKAR